MKDKIYRALVTKRIFLLFFSTLFLIPVVSAEVPIVSVYDDDTHNGYFKVVASKGMENGHEWVNLGQEMMWATVNIGANSPTDKGDLYAWGETELNPTMSKDWYGSYQVSNYVGDRTQLQLSLSNDAAHVNWGGGWRMPSLSEWNTLMNNCIWTWKSSNNKQGYMVSNGTDSVFLIQTYDAYNVAYSSFSGNCAYALYWSSTRDPYTTSYAKAIGGCQYSGGPSATTSAVVEGGHSIRPICKPSINDNIVLYLKKSSSTKIDTIIPEMGQEIQLKAEVSYGYHFARWNDDNTDNPRTIIMTQDTTFTAEFAKNIYSVSVIYDEDKGTVTGESGEFEYLTELTYKATPKYGYHFSYWNIGGTNTSDTVKFLLPDSWYDPYAWIWETNGSGEWVKLQKKDGYYVCLAGANKNILFVPYGPYWDYGQSEDVSIAAGGIYKVEEDQYVYNRYSVYCNVVTEISGGGSIIKNDSITLTVNDSIVIHAVFRPNQYILATNSDSITNGIVVGTGEFDYLSEDTISAVPDLGYHFTQWSDGNTDNPRVIVLTQDTTFTAEFALNLTDKCGKDSALTWAYDLETKTLTFSGNGELTENYTFGVVARLAENIVLPEVLTAIGESAFYNSKHVKEIVVPATTTVIDNYAFADCDSLQSLTIKNGEAELGYGVANNCKSLRFIEAPAEIMQGHYSTAHQAVTFNGGEMISDYFFGLSPMTLQSLDLGKTTVTTFPNNILSTFRYLKTLVLPTNMTEIEYALAADCYYLDSITIPAGVTEIDDRAFYNCHSLAKVEFAGTNLQRIGAWAFYNCHELSQINLPEGVTEIGKAAFYGCAYANQAHIPASVQAIGDNAFALCSKLSKMVVDAVVPPTVGSKTFEEVSTTAPVYVPENSVDTYKSHPVWGKLNIVGNPNAPQSVENVQSNQVQCTKILRDGQIFILRGEKTYTLQGQEIIVP